MKSAATDDTAIYHNGRTYAEHCTWLDSLVGDEYRMVHIPSGHLFSLANVAYFKRALLTLEMTAGERMRFLEGIGSCVHGCVTQEAVEVIEPACNTAMQMLQELNKVDRAQRSQAFSKGGIFRLLAKLNPSLLSALRLCKYNHLVPEQPRNPEART